MSKIFAGMWVNIIVFKRCILLAILAANIGDIAVSISAKKNMSDI
ncbi:MAG: hypothetical protein QXN83_10495 [Nitrososphaerales archaeon]